MYLLASLPEGRGGQALVLKHLSHELPVRPGVPYNMDICHTPLMDDWFSKGLAQPEYYREDQLGGGCDTPLVADGGGGGCEAGSGQQVAAR